ncbi:hypothetical protein B0I37DRAFT_445999 [Chaetomium sp. MPI-CAGE-AT-0009]|nr:hypothetical protein B0I37DRAFT_445999 [Chaetomium sp. MPI-CAGE-AT-0009]
MSNNPTEPSSQGADDQPLFEPQLIITLFIEKLLEAEVTLPEIAAAFENMHNTNLVTLFPAYEQILGQVRGQVAEMGAATAASQRAYEALEARYAERGRVLERLGARVEELVGEVEGLRAELGGYDEEEMDEDDEEEMDEDEMDEDDEEEMEDDDDDQEDEGGVRLEGAGNEN